jgi:hypothetical protein
MFIQSSILFSFLTVFSFHISAPDELPEKDAWLKDFMAEGLRTAYAEWVYSDQQDYNREEIKTSYYDFETQEYLFEFELKYSSNWDVLTRDGTMDPPKMNKRYASSKVSQWTNFKGIGTYSESYERKIPNWLYFKNLDSVLVIFLSERYEPAVNKLLWTDEQKQIKKLGSSGKSEQAYIWKQFNYDHKGNIIGISTDYLNKNSSARKFDSRMSYAVHFENHKGQRLTIEPLTANSNYGIIDGVKLSFENNSSIIFDQSLNKKMYKFCPDIFKDPKKVLRTFLFALQEESGKQLERLAED